MLGLQAYPCLCAYYAIYKLGRFSFYLLVPRHTSPYSLLANAMLMCRFAPPLAFNFMAGIALPPGKSYSPGRDVTETVRPLCFCSTGHSMMLCCSSALSKTGRRWVFYHCHYWCASVRHCPSRGGPPCKCRLSALGACLLGMAAWSAHHLQVVVSAPALSLAAGGG